MGIGQFLAILRYVHLNFRISPSKFLDDTRLTVENLLKIEETDGKSRTKQIYDSRVSPRGGGLRGSGFGTYVLIFLKFRQ